MDSYKLMHCIHVKEKEKKEKVSGMATAQSVCIGSKMCSTANGLQRLLPALNSLNKIKIKF